MIRGDHAGIWPRTQTPRSLYEHDKKLFFSQRWWLSVRSLWGGGRLTNPCNATLVAWECVLIFSLLIELYPCRQGKKTKRRKRSRRRRRRRGTKRKKAVSKLDLLMLEPYWWAVEINVTAQIGTNQTSRTIDKRHPAHRQNCLFPINGEWNRDKQKKNNFFPRKSLCLHENYFPLLFGISITISLGRLDKVFNGSKKWRNFIGFFYSWYSIILREEKQVCHPFTRWSTLMSWAQKSVTHKPSSTRLVRAYDGNEHPRSRQEYVALSERQSNSPKNEPKKTKASGQSTKKAALEII